MNTQTKATFIKALAAILHELQREGIYKSPGDVYAGTDETQTFFDMIERFLFLNKIPHARNADNGSIIAESGHRNAIPQFQKIFGDTTYFQIAISDDEKLVSYFEDRNPVFWIDYITGYEW